MSAAVTADPRRGSFNGLIFGGIAIVAIILGFFFLNRSDPPLERQATGIAALPAWLRENGVHATLFKGGHQIPRRKVSLRILPIYDTDLLRRRHLPETREEVIEQTSEYDLSRFVVAAKLAKVSTLVVLPKWRSGVRALGIAHRDLLIPAAEIERLLGQIGLETARVRTAPDGLETTRARIGGEEFDLRLMHAQTITAGRRCEPVIGSTRDMLLGSCRDEEGTEFWLLTDPDLLANHALSLGQNGRAVLAMIETITPKSEKTDPDAGVLVDMSTRAWIVERTAMAETYERKWENFVRMFRWPFTMIWIGFAAVAGLVTWRAFVRYGPLARLYSEEPGATKTLSIAAKARLLRLSDHDEELLQSHMQHRLQRLAAAIIGPHRRSGGDPLGAIVPIVRRHDPALADDLLAAVGDAKGDVMNRLDRFETVYDRIRDEFGRPSGPDRRPT